MREKADYRDNRALLKEASNGKMLISYYEAARIIGVNPKTLWNTKEILDMTVEIGKQRRLPLVGLARWMS